LTQDAHDSDRADASKREAVGPSGDEPTWPEADRRSHHDRRHRPTPSWAAFLGLRRRRAGRRAGETQDVYVDVFRSSDILLLVGIFVLNIFDALFTLLWLERGGGEGNPIMKWMLEEGDYVFLIQKCLVVGLWLVFLMIHKNFRFAKIGLWSLATFYALVILYHFVLIASGVDPKTGTLPGDREARSIESLDRPYPAAPNDHAAR